MTTIRDVAQKAGVSVGTVSAVINKNKYVSPQLEARVVAAIESLDYHPSHFAQALKRRRTHTLAYLVPDVTNPGFSRALRAMTQIARERGYTVLVLNTDGEPEIVRQFVQQLIGLRVDGVLLALTWDLARPDLIEALQDRDIEVVGLSGSRTLDTIDCFLWDETEAGYKLARYLLRLGHRDIAFLGPTESESAARRLEGVKRALADAGVPMRENQIYRVDGYSSEKAYDGTLHAISMGEPFSTLVTFNDSYTTGALAAFSDQGFHVPEHISIATFGTYHTTFARPQITSMAYDEHEVGTRASNRLIDRIEGHYDKDPQKEYSPLDLVVRTSCRALAASAPLLHHPR